MLVMCVLAVCEQYRTVIAVHLRNDDTVSRQMELIEFMRAAFLLVVCRGQTVKPNGCANRLPDFNCTVKVRFFEHNPFVICNQLLSEDMEVNGRPVITWPSGVEVN